LVIVVEFACEDLGTGCASDFGISPQFFTQLSGFAAEA
jgi:hypothetical protein